MANRYSRELEGVVRSNKMEKTAIVEVTRLVQHAQYLKVVKRRKKFVAHDEKKQAKIGDHVRIRECRPLSKTKRWRITQIVKTAAQ